MKYLSWIVVGVILVGAGIATSYSLNKSSTKTSDLSITTKSMPSSNDQNAQPTETKVATFAAGCFRCIEPAYQEEPGVIDAIVGYAGGTEPDPTYELVGKGTTDYREAVQVTYDPSLIDYPSLVQIFWSSIDPTDAGGQFVDRGFQYTTAIYYHDETQQQIAEESKQTMDLSGEYDKSIATVILPYTTFYPAEDYHQDFYKHAAERYKRYKNGSGRPEYFAEDK